MFSASTIGKGFESGKELWLDNLLLKMKCKGVACYDCVMMPSSIIYLRIGCVEIVSIMVNSYYIR